MASWAVERLAQVCSEVLLADRGRGLLDGIESIEDGIGAGPAAALLGAARARPGVDLLVLACDLPQVPIALLKALAERDPGQSWVPRHPGRPEVAWDFQLEPLCARFSSSALAILEDRVRSGDFALHGWLGSGQMPVHYLEGEELLRLGDPCELFLNLNRPEDLARFDPETTP